MVWVRLVVRTSRWFCSHPGLAGAGGLGRATSRLPAFPWQVKEAGLGTPLAPTRTRRLSSEARSNTDRHGLRLVGTSGPHPSAERSHSPGCCYPGGGQICLESILGFVMYAASTDLLPSCCIEVLRGSVRLSVRFAPSSGRCASVSERGSLGVGNGRARRDRPLEAGAGTLATGGGCPGVF